MTKKQRKTLPLEIFGQGFFFGMGKFFKKTLDSLGDL